MFKVPKFSSKKSASKVLDWGPNPSRQKCLEQFGFGLDPSPPLGQCPNQSRFFFGITSLSLTVNLYGTSLPGARYTKELKILPYIVQYIVT